MPNGYSRPRKTSLCHHPGPEIHPKAHKYLPATAESCFMTFRIFRQSHKLASWRFTISYYPPQRACFESPRFTLSLSGTHALRSLLRSLRHVLPSEGVAVSVSRYCIARGTSTPGRATETSIRRGKSLSGAIFNSAFITQLFEEDRVPLNHLNLESFLT